MDNIDDPLMNSDFQTRLPDLIQYYEDAFTISEEHDEEFNRMRDDLQLNELHDFILRINNVEKLCDLRNGYGYTYLFLACGNNDYGVAKIMIEQNVDVNLQIDGFNALKYACMFDGDSKNMVKMLIEAKADVNDYGSGYSVPPLAIAANKNDVDLLNLLVDNKASLHTSTNNMFSMIYYATTYEKQFLNSSEANDLFNNTEGNEALQLLLKYMSDDVGDGDGVDDSVEVKEDSCVNANTPNNHLLPYVNCIYNPNFAHTNAGPPFIHNCEYNSLYNSLTSPSPSPSPSCSLLMAVATSEQCHFLPSLITYGANAQEVNSNGHHALMAFHQSTKSRKTRSKSYHSSVPKAFQNRGIDLSLKLEDGSCLLSLAVTANQDEAVEALLNCGVSPCVTDHLGNQLLITAYNNYCTHRATFNKFPIQQKTKVLKSLLNHGYITDDHMHQFSPDTLNNLNNLNNPNNSDTPNTPNTLHTHISPTSPNSLVNLDLSDSKHTRSTLLSEIIKRNEVKPVKMELLQLCCRLGADTNILDQAQNPPLFYIFNRNDKLDADIVMLLVDHGADIFKVKVKAGFGTILTRTCRMWHASTAVREAEDEEERVMRWEKVDQLVKIVLDKEIDRLLSHSLEELIEIKNNEEKEDNDDGEDGKLGKGRIPIDSNAVIQPFQVPLHLGANIPRPE